MGDAWAGAYTRVGGAQVVAAFRSFWQLAWDARCGHAVSAVDLLLREGETATANENVCVGSTVGSPPSPILSPLSLSLSLSLSCFHLAAELSRTLMKVGRCCSVDEGRKEGRKERRAGEWAAQFIHFRHANMLLCGVTHSLRLFGLHPSAPLSLRTGT